MRPIEAILTIVCLLLLTWWTATNDVKIHKLLTVQSKIIELQELQVEVMEEQTKQIVKK